LQNTAAKRCLATLAGIPDYIDEDCQINYQQLLAYTWLAINDVNLHQAKLEDVLNLFCEGLYEAQRGYNLDENGVDSLSAVDSHVCEEGMFHKILEKLAGVHPDVRIEFITPSTATLKLSVVIQEEAIQYLKGVINPQTAKEFVGLNQRLIRMEATHIDEIIWNNIKDRVSERMWDEFNSLFSNQNDPNFIGLIEAGQYKKLNRSPEIQSILADSEGYRKHCSHTLFNSRFFHRPQPVKAQNAYAEIAEDALNKLFCP